MTKAVLNALREAVLEDAESDIVSLTSLIHLVETVDPKADSPSGLKARVLELIGVLIDVDGLSFGTWSRKSFLEVWPGSTSVVLARISHEWTALKREPTLGDIGYLGYRHLFGPGWNEDELS